MVGKIEIRLIFGKDKTIVAKLTGMPFVSKEGHKVIRVGFAKHLPRFRPMTRVDLESPHPLHVSVARHFWHVVPGSMSREGKKVEVLTSQVNGTLQLVSRIIGL